MPDISAEQATAIDLALVALDKCQDFVIKGRAGVGKSRLIRELIRRIPDAVIGCPTHKSVDVLKGYGVKANTVHSLLGITAIKFGYGYGEDDGLVFGQATKYLPTTAIVDECSMIGATMYRDLSDRAINGVIYVGDPYQLPPVGEVESTPFSQVSGQYELTEVFRGGVNTRLSRACNYVLDVLKGNAPWSLADFYYWLSGVDNSVILRVGHIHMPYDIFLTYTNRRAECLPYGSTIHKAQGSEWNVVMVDLDNILKATDNMMFNIRLLYVALTRARETVIIYTVEGSRYLDTSI